MKLRDKIIQKSIELFNKHGIANVSSNQIAYALNISTGNLTYHFKTKAVLIEALYQLLEERFEEKISFDGYITLDHFRRSIVQCDRLQEDFQFFYHDIVLISRNYPKVGKMYNEITSKQITHVRNLVDYFISTDRFVPEENGINYDLLIQNLWMVTISWETQSEIIQQPRIVKYADDLVALIWHMILPYLSDKGKEEYDQINFILNNQDTTLSTE